ncbi:hypothetical protein DL767_007175 [Monosporascus sp. MG133]|nr:hypothetical protein DL767_007175 [Monosporascus sp. MG133]
MLASAKKTAHTTTSRINEEGHFTESDSTNDHESWEPWKKYDNELFQTGRLITCGLISTLVCERRSAYNSATAPEAMGNQISADFYLAYRWHTAISRGDEKWITEDPRYSPDAVELYPGLVSTSVWDVIVPLNTRFVAGFFRAADQDAEMASGIGSPTFGIMGGSLLSRMMEKGKPNEECVTGTVIPIGLPYGQVTHTKDRSAAGATIMSSLLSQCMDYFLGTGIVHLPQLYRLAHENSAAADEKPVHYMLEDIRLRDTVVVSRSVAPTSAPQKVTDGTPCLYDPTDPTGPSPIPSPLASRAALSRTYTLAPGRKAVEGDGAEWTGLRVYLTSDQGAHSPAPTTMRARWRSAPAAEGSKGKVVGLRL